MFDYHVFLSEQHLPVNFRKLPLIAWILVAATPVFSTSAETVRGQVTKTVFMPDGTKGMTVEAGFDVVVRGDEYSMVIKQNANTGGHVSQVVTSWSRKGGVLYKSDIFPGNGATAAGADEPIRCNGYLYDEMMPPPGSADLAMLLWLAYVWRAPKDAPLPGKLRPIWMFDYPGLWETGITLPVTITPSKRFPGRAEKIVYMTDGKSRFIHPETGKPAEAPAPAPFDRGSLCATLEMDFAATPNPAGVPQKASFRRYYPNLTTRKSRDDLSLVDTSEIVTLESSADSPEIQLPALLPRSNLMETRLGKDALNRQLTYQITSNGQWSLPNPKFMAMVNLEERRIRASESGNEPVSKTAFPVRRVLFLIAMIIVLVASGYQLVRKRTAS